MRHDAEAKNHIGENMVNLQRTEDQMLLFRNELEVATKAVQNKSQIANTLLSLQAKIPEAEQTFWAISDSLNTETMMVQQMRKEGNQMFVFERDPLLKNREWFGRCIVKKTALEEPASSR